MPLFADAVRIQRFTAAGLRGISRNCVRPATSSDQFRAVRVNYRRARAAAASAYGTCEQEQSDISLPLNIGQILDRTRQPWPGRIVDVDLVPARDFSAAALTEQSPDA